MPFFIFSPIILAENLENSTSEVVDNVTDKEPSWYAIIKVDSKKKLYTTGDIFCSNIDITRCLRVEDIKKDELVLKSVNSEDIFIVKPGERIPLEETEIIFENTVNTDVVRDGKAEH